jgi:hypothetical protein
LGRAFESLTRGFLYEKPVHKERAETSTHSPFPKKKVIRSNMEGKLPVPVTAHDGYNVVQWIEACYQSARRGTRPSPDTLVSKQPAAPFATQTR